METLIETYSINTAYSNASIPPKGYVTGNVFWSEVRRRMDKKCCEYGVLQRGSI
ncbi:MAG: hypothetical protein LBN27_13135 [Prevotellaceae bacterium]|nr:hypothetical protein [Prevotellaceae bacterium]